MRDEVVATSKFLSYVLRHHPGSIGLSLDAQGWVAVDDLVDAARRHGRALDRALVERVVRENNKRRFALSPDGTRIRASQGHSVAVDLGLAAVPPPELLYHGTASRNVRAILENGLVPGRRQHVHLSADMETAAEVGRRHGEPVVLIVHASKLHEAGQAFYLSANGVWLTEHVPTAYIRAFVRPGSGPPSESSSP